MEHTVAIVVMVGREPVTVWGWMVIYENGGLVILRVKLGMDDGAEGMLIG